MPKTEPLEVQTEPLTPRRELADRKRRPSSSGSPGSHPAVLGSRARRASHELVVAQEACDDDAQEPPQPPPPSRMEQARDDLLRYMERPCWARLVSRTGLEPQAKQAPDRSATHACEPRLGQAVVHLLWIIGDGALFFFLLMNWQVCNPMQRGLQPCAARPATLCGPACNPMRCGLQPYAAGSIALLMNRRQAMCTPVDGMCEPRNWWYNLSIQVRDGLFA